MKLLMTTDTVGGVWNYALELAGRLRERDVRVVLAALGGPLSRAQQAQAATAELVVHESSYRLEWMHDPWADVAESGDWLRSLAVAESVDLVHVNGYAHAALPWEVPVLAVAHSCVYSWWRAVHGRRAPEPEWARYRVEVARGLAAADAVVSPTRALLAAMEREYGRIPGARVIPNGRTAERPPQFRKQPLVVTAGRLWDDAKNLHVLRAAAPAVPWPIRVIGPTRAPDGGTADPGPLEALGVLAPHELRAVLDRAAVYAAPALYEPFGLAVLEAAQAGCALVLSDIPTFRELWDEAALFVPPRDAAAVAGALRLLANDPYLRARLSLLAAQRALQYSADAMADAYLRLYAEILQRRPSAVDLCV